MQVKMFINQFSYNVSLIFITTDMVKCVILSMILLLPCIKNVFAEDYESDDKCKLLFITNIVLGKGFFLYYIYVSKVKINVMY